MTINHSTRVSTTDKLSQYLDSLSPTGYGTGNTVEIFFGIWEQIC